MNIVALESLLGLFGFWIVVYYLWPDFRSDSYREDIFSLRGEMFEYAVTGKIAFDHPAYTLLRTRMNALLRHGHELTLTRVLIVSTVCKGMQPDPNNSFFVWLRAVENLRPEVRDQIKEFNLRLNVYVLQHVMYRSFFRYLALRPLMSIINVRVIIEQPHVVNTVEKLETAALEEELCPAPAMTA